jgi:hypothetical protein
MQFGREGEGGVSHKAKSRYNADAIRDSTSAGTKLITQILGCKAKNRTISKGLHPDRTLGRHRHHFPPCRNAAARVG